MRADLNDAMEEECGTESGRLFQSNGASTRRLEVSGWKTKKLNIGRQPEFARWNIQLDEIKEIGRGLIVQ